MRLDALLSTIILVAFVVTILMAVASYAAYKVRERRRPSPNDMRPRAEDESYFERVLPDPPPPSRDA